MRGTLNDYGDYRAGLRGPVRPGPFYITVTVPEKRSAAAIMRRLSVPGAFEREDLGRRVSAATADGRLHPARRDQADSATPKPIRCHCGGIALGTFGLFSCGRCGRVVRVNGLPL